MFIKLINQIMVIVIVIVSCDVQLAAAHHVVALVLQLLADFVHFVARVGVHLVLARRRRRAGLAAPLARLGALAALVAGLAAEDRGEEPGARLLFFFFLRCNGHCGLAVGGGAQRGAGRAGPRRAVGRRAAAQAARPRRAVRRCAAAQAARPRGRSGAGLVAAAAAGAVGLRRRALGDRHG